MQPLSSSDILRIWEGGVERGVVERSGILLAHACREFPRDDLLDLSVGTRDGRLLELRRATFGSRFQGYVECPSCSTRLEFELPLAELPVNELPVTNGAPTDGYHEFSEGGYDVRVRLPTTRDQAAVAAAATAEDGREVLIERCVLEASRGGERVSAAELPPEVQSRVAGRIAEADPLAEVLLSFDCASCGHSWQSLFDIGTILWTEVAGQARRLLLEVQALARAYGWAEADILAMSPQRRRAYLEGPAE